MPDIILPESFCNLLGEFRQVFTAPSFQNFRLLVCGFVHALGQHRLTNALRAVGPLASKHFTTYYRFVSRARWSLDELGLALLAVVLGAFGSPILVRLVLDDTLTHRTGKKVALATSHADPVLKQSDGRPFVSYGHVFVVLSIHVSATWIASTGWALPFLFRLFEGSKQGGKLDSPSDQLREHGRRQAGKKQRSRVRLRDQKAVDGKLVPCQPEPDTGPLPDDVRPTKLQLATEMLLLVARQYPNIKFRVLADHLYTGHAVLHGVHSRVSNVHFIMRGRPDAALFTLPTPREPGQPGRPRVKGEQLPNPEAWAKLHTEEFRRENISMYGKSVEVELASYLGMPYRSLPGRLVRYVIVRDPRGIYRPTYIFCTDPDVPASEVVEEYARRWPLEVAFEASKQKLGIEHPRTQLPTAVRRSAPFGMVLYSMIVLWYLRDGFQIAASAALPPDPWYPKTTRPSFSDMLACLRRASWSQWFLDPPCSAAEREEILANYMCRVVASG